MVYDHIKWDRNGRVFRVLDDLGKPTGQMVWQGSIAQECVPDGSGGWTPYILSGDVIKYGNNFSEIEFASDSQILRHAANVVSSSFKLFVQAYINDQWVTQPHGLPTRNVAHNYPIEGHCTGFLNFPDAHLSFGQQLPYGLRVGLEVGMRRYAVFGIRLRSPISGQLRFQVVLDSIAKLPTDWEWIDSMGPLSGPRVSRHVGIRVRDMVWRWSYDEAPYRSITKEDNVDGSMKLVFTLGPYSITANEWFTVYPDQWGMGEVANEEDDAIESWAGAVDLDGLYDSGLFYLTGSTEGSGEYVGFRWRNVTMSGTISNTSQLFLTNNGDNNLGVGVDPDWILVAQDAQTPAVFSASSNNISSRTPTTAQETGAPQTGNLTITGADFASILQELVDTYTYDGDDPIVLMMYNVYAGGEYWGLAWDSVDGAGAAAQLTIVYTPAAGGTLSVNLNDGVTASEYLDPQMSDIVVSVHDCSDIEEMV